ncbi:MAG: GNAT family N-acetyltransferase [Lachnospiraceae bacterium]|nr:GNAT family N-acetyltransferase [Lachnospiraceae bacterium]
MDKNIAISNATILDWEPAMELAWKTFLKFEASEYGKEGTDSFLEFVSSEKLFEMFQNGDYKVIVAKDQNDIIGVASLRSKNHISLLFVDERHHRTGVGKALLSTLQDSLPKGETEMTVNAAPFAVGFYEKIGFVKSDEMKKADGIVFQPMVVNKKIER